MSIFHNGKEYGATKVINYSAAPDYNKGISITNIQDGNYQATDNGFIVITLQSQQSNVTKVSIVRSKTPITDNEGIEIASRVIQQFQYSETLTVQVMAREYYKLLIDGVGNPQIISCMFYPYASTVPMKLTENISVEQVEGLETAYVRDLYYNIIDDTSPITSVKELPYGWNLLIKQLDDRPEDYIDFIIPLVQRKQVGSNDDLFLWYFSYLSIPAVNLRYYGNFAEDGRIIWNNNLKNIDLSISTEVSQTGTFSASQTVLMIENDVIKKIPKEEIKINLTSQAKDVLGIANGGTGTDDGFNFANYIDFKVLASRIGFEMGGTIEDFVSKLPNACTFTTLAVAEQLSGILYNGLITVRIHDKSFGWIRLERLKNDTNLGEAIAPIPNKVFSGWKTIRNINGTIPASCGGVLTKYENSYGIWTETLLETGEVMLEGWGSINLEAKEVYIIETPKKIVEDLKKVFITAREFNASTETVADGINVGWYSKFFIVNTMSSRVDFVLWNIKAILA